MFFDSETTGLSKNSVIRLENQPSIIELFCVTLNDETFEELEVWQSLFSHNKPLEKIIIQITGINDEMIRTAPKFFQKAEELKKYIESHEIVVGHNLTFDMERVDQEMQRCNLKVNWPATKICTVEQTEFLRGYRLSLNALHEYLFEDGFKDAHRAEPDVRAMVRCYIELKKRAEL